MKIGVDVGKGFTFEQNKLTTKWVEGSKIEKREDGIYIPNMKGKPGISGRSVEDNYTVMLNERYNMIQTNPNVVEYIFSMCGYKVIESTRGSVDTYSVDKNSIKTPQDIINEINIVVDTNNLYNCTNYNMRSGNLFQLRDTVSCGKPSNWPVAVDDGNRFFGSNCLALFYMNEVVHPTIGTKFLYTNSIKMTCLWSTVPEYVKGQEYTANGKSNF